MSEKSSVADRLRSPTVRSISVRGVQRDGAIVNCHPPVDVSVEEPPSLGDQHGSRRQARDDALGRHGSGVASGG